MAPYNKQPEFSSYDDNVLDKLIDYCTEDTSNLNLKNGFLIKIENILRNATPSYSASICSSRNIDFILWLYRLEKVGFPNSSPDLLNLYFNKIREFYSNYGLQKSVDLINSTCRRSIDETSDMKYEEIRFYGLLFIVYYIYSLPPDQVYNSYMETIVKTFIDNPITVDVMFTYIEDIYVPNERIMSYSMLTKYLFHNGIIFRSKEKLTLENLMENTFNGTTNHTDPEYNRIYTLLCMKICDIFNSPNHILKFIDDAIDNFLIYRSRIKINNAKYENFTTSDDAIGYLASTMDARIARYLKEANKYNDDIYKKSSLESFISDFHYKIAPEFKTYIKDEYKDKENHIITSFIYENLKAFDLSNNSEIREFFDEYLPSMECNIPLPAYEAANDDIDPEPSSEAPADDDLETPTSNGNYRRKRFKKDQLKKSAAGKTMDAEKKIYSAYRQYKEKESAVDNQLVKMTNVMKDKFKGNVREEIIGGKVWTPITILKKALGTAAIFSFSKIGGILAFIVGHYTKRKVKNKERKKIILELELEIKMLEEKIEDAKGDGNRQAKYAMMRTKAELENAVEKIKFGLEADDRAVQAGMNVIKGGVNAALSNLK